MTETSIVANGNAVAQEYQKREIANRIEAAMNAAADKHPSEVLSPDDYKWYRDYLLLEWQVAKETLEVAKEREMILRKQTVAYAFDPNKDSGTERIELGAGYQAKAVKKITYGFVKTEEGKLNKQAIDDALSAIEATGPVGVLTAERLVKWTPDLSLTEYKQLPDEFKKIIDAVIVTDEGAPTLEIIAPKAKK